MKTTALLPFALLAAGCATRYGTEVAICDELFPTGTRVVMWDEAGGFDAYSHDPAFPLELPEDAEPPTGARYGHRVPRDAALAAEVEASGWTLDALRRQVDQVVVHYDAAGTSRRCFRILQDLRGLSCHFLIDVDGTVYQCLDLRERAWHAGTANDRSVGIELAQIGAWPEERRDVLEEHYAEDALGPYLVLPDGPDRGQLPPGLVGRPAARPARRRGPGPVLAAVRLTRAQCGP
ncbi:MAG: peptidoglycan recognition family protein [Planctomycetota bacterium]